MAPAPSDRDWKTIVERIHAGQCVPFLGAGVNASGNGYEGLKLGREVALRFAQELIVAKEDLTSFDDLAAVQVLNEALRPYPDLLRLELHNLARVAFHLERVVDTPELMRILQELLTEKAVASKKAIVPSDLLRTLARLPLKLIVTTNYDWLMERALEEAGRPYRQVNQPVEGFRPQDLRRLNDDLAEDKAVGTVILYKLHGSFPRDGGAFERVVITEEDYIEFLTVMGNQEIGIPETVRSELSTGTLLFLGYSLEDWDFRTLFKGTVERLERYEMYRSFAIQVNPSDYWVEFWRSDKKKVSVFDISVHDFAAQLATEYDDHVRRTEGLRGD